MDNENKQLEKFGNIYSTMMSEGDGYYFYGYESESTFDFDEKLKQKFIEANKAIESFKSHVEAKITENGGNVEDWES